MLRTYLSIRLLVLLGLLLTVSHASAQYRRGRVVRVVTVVRPASYWHPHPAIVREVIVHQNRVYARRVIVTRRVYRR